MSDYESSDFISDDENETYDYADFMCDEGDEELSEDFSYDDDESDLDNFDVFPITAHRQKYIMRSDDYLYY